MCMSNIFKPSYIATSLTTKFYLVSLQVVSKDNIQNERNNKVLVKEIIDVLRFK